MVLVGMECTFKFVSSDISKSIQCIYSFLIVLMVKKKKKKKLYG